MTIFKYIVALMLVVSPLAVSANTLSHAQVGSILLLLQAFGVDSETVEKVAGILSPEKPVENAFEKEVCDPKNGPGAWVAVDNTYLFKCQSNVY